MNRILPKAKLTDVNPLPPSHGKVPWKITYRRTRRYFHVGITVVLDADGNELCTCVSPEIAGRIVAAVNMVECAHIKDRSPKSIDERS